MNLYNLIAINPITGELIENIVDTKDNIIEISPIELDGDSLDHLDNGVESIIFEGENIKVEITKMTYAQLKSLKRSIELL
ncbi:hypothetical protein [Aquimarina algicola]|uniref:Uncharacterized protein n=1 Tax=Aquimarina algicola TaxID=2589995 RepID=A0A504JLE9_9FLAO|nr:hypothetical protein [Aquimarina algicola]TPN87401.1 hypothetical protein FHK87_07395 [Aquimarina algicola]